MMGRHIENRQATKGRDEPSKRRIRKQLGFSCDDLEAYH